jgi:hypothetical protein
MTTTTPPTSRSALTAALATAILSLALTLPAQVLGLAETPPAPVDGRDYDHLALNLARGRGFAYCWSDPEWRAPYEHAENSSKYALHLSLGGPCFPTARRAPGFPAALAAVYRVAGRSFEAGRLSSAVTLALAGAIGAFLAARVAGAVAAALFAVCFLFDAQLRFLVGAYMSEPMAALAVMGVLAAHIVLVRTPTLRHGILAGVSVGLLMLVRHHFSLLFALALATAALGVVRGRGRRPLFVAYAAAALLVFAPWGVRNSLVVGAPMPLGTQGGHGLAAAYGEDTLAGDDGTWNSDQSAQVWAKAKGKPSGYTFADLARELRSSLALEREVAEVGQAAARDWLRRHWRRLPGIAWVRLRAHATGYGALGLAAVLAGLAALVLVETRREAALGFAVLATTALTVALTYEEARGRYAAPVRPAAYLVGALGLAASANRLLQARRHAVANGARQP